jgi:hypothetical protein
MTPTELADAISATEDASAFREGADTLAFIAPLSGKDRERWLDLRDAAPAFLSGIFITDADGDVVLERDLPPVPGERFRVTLRKARVPDCLDLLFASSMRSMAGVAAGYRTVRIAGMGTEETFTTFAARYQTWTSDPAPPFSAAEPLADPRAFVKDFTERGTVPSDVRPWLLSAGPVTRGTAFDTWRTAATERLLPALADQVSLEDGTVRHHFAGPPRVTMSPSPEALAQLADGVQAAALWIYAEGRDAEARHLLLANEWARAYRPGGEADLGALSLDSAKSAYAAFVRSGSKETLKALADLRKSVVEESQKASQRAQDLSGALWKDLAVASAPFVLKVLPDSAKAGSVAVSAILAFGAAGFLAYSFGVQAYINDRFFQHQGESRVVWRTALNAVFSKEELDAFSETPIARSLADYRNVRNLVGGVYAALIIGLAAFGIYEAQGALAGAGPAVTTTMPVTNPSGQAPSPPAPSPIQGAPPPAPSHPNIPPATP